MKKLFVLLTLLAVGLTACEKPAPEPSTSEVVLTLTSEGAMVFDNNGGMGTITYTLENPVEGEKLEVSADCDWIININDSVDGEISFTVKRNQAGLGRSGNITAKYADKEFTVIINQKSNLDIDVTVEAPNLKGIYYGRRDGGSDNYYIMFTNGDLIFDSTQYDEYGRPYSLYLKNTPNAYYYIVDLFVDAEDDGSRKVPDGVYTLDLYNTGGGNQFMLGFSMYSLNDASGWATEEWNYSTGSLVVEGNKMELTVTLYDYENSIELDRHFVTFEGEYELYDDSI